MAVVTSNLPIFQSMSNCFKQLILSVGANYVPKQSRDIITEFSSELSAFTRYLISIKNEQITHVLKELDKEVETTSNTLALFVEEMLAPSREDIYTFVGVKNRNQETLYGAYVEFCENKNLKTLLSVPKFKNQLLEVCREIGWNVRGARQRNQEYRIYGVKLRSQQEVAPSISES
ncbi:hypothetical protein NIES4071_104930 (plasmid) [Calothrix sp. NIES-4071]|nr:hypothetical protein NIES4071_104930 [Calothrix sp. NIES-4071]BAZ64911.1 hypothetical protein NIES4105_106440 [Calothrix sp. NIES-4105]